MKKTYDPKEVEQKWYQYWEEKGYFHAEVDESKEPFCVVIPPPNITGQLHMGHALDNTYQDILVRWKRMQGCNTVWIPGTDHAGIATQARVEDHIRETEGKTRHDLGREEFLRRTWAWKEEYGRTILNQLKRLGASLDWQRERFTMDEGCSRAVREVFVRLFEKGWIYQGNYSVNWCPVCSTTLSDIEVEHEESAGKLYHIKYPIADGSGYVEIATTRPETMLGDTAVAVNPGDERYRHLVGQMVIVPLVDREVPVIADDYVDMEFGTGVVKITPAHDPNDFEIGQRHNLPQVQVIGRDAVMTDEAGKYAGLDRYEARRSIVEDLQQLGLLVKVEEHQHAVGQCYRCGTVVEPLVSKQWFVKMAELAKPAIAAVENGEIRFIPERFSKHYLHWMRNIRDWCISRQLWWGHRIPVWYCRDCGEVFARVDEPTSCAKCGSENIYQDPDVLDTWFSSALWPFSTLGWPDETKELKHFYPTSVLVTGFDIIFFWVARMIVMGYEFMGDRPFKEVFIHGLVRDALGRKMSKSLGNGVDPIEAIEQYGADALRFNLVIGVAPGNDMRYIPEKVEAYRNFANKIWNASRFALMNLDDFDPQEENLGSLELAAADYWILSRYEFTAQEVTRFLERYDVGEAARVLYDFIWSELCDWYIELIKPRLYGKQGEKTRYAAQYVLWYVLKGTLELLHPFMPFITEEIWQNLPHDGETIMLAPWPNPAGLRSPKHERIMHTVMAVITEIRSMRSEKNVPPGRKITAICQADPEGLEILSGAQEDIRNLAGLETLILEEPVRTPEKSLSAVVEGVNIFLPLAELVDLEEEKARLQKELEQARRELQRAEKNLRNEGFISKAPQEVVEKEKEKAELYRAQVARLEALLQELLA
ncbi:MAG TPA: valine--tRNA ligase [Limnochordia bacterium]|nr:valine--tRNA ligase [Limnochordia bacterium]